MDIWAPSVYTLPVMLQRSYKSQESLVRYWALQAVALCSKIEDDGLDEFSAPVHEAIAAMERERRIVFFGGRGCGKTALLSRVASCPVMAAVPFESPYLRWRYACADGDCTHSRFIPEERLEGLELVDTQACDTPEQTEVLRGLLPDADVAVAVVDARSYESSPVWELLAGLPEESTSVVMIALTFTDSLSAEASLELSAAMRELSRTRLGRVLPAYAVSPASETAVESFTLRVQEALSAPAGVRAAIRRVLNAAVDLMYKQGSVLKGREDVARTNSGFLSGIEQEIDNFLSHQMTGVKGCTDSYVDSVYRVSPKLLRRLHRAFGFLCSPVTLLRLELFGSGVEKTFYRMMRADVNAIQQESDHRFCTSCSGHWRSVRPRMKQTLQCEIGEFPEESLNEELAKLRGLMAREMYIPFVNERFRAQLSEAFKARVGWMQVAIVTLCLLLTLAGLLGFIGQDVLAIGVLSLAGSVWLVASVVQWVAFSHLRREIETKAEALHSAMRASLAPAVENLIISRVAAYRRLYAEPRRKVSKHISLLKPLQQEHGEIYRQLRGAAPRV